MTVDHTIHLYERAYTCMYVHACMYVQRFDVRYAPKKKVSGLSVSTSKVRTVLPTVGTVPSGTHTILWLVNGSCKEVSVSEVKQG